MNIVIDFILSKLIKKGRLVIIDASNRVKIYGRSDSAPTINIRILDNSFFYKFLLRPGLTLGEFYMNKKLLIEDATIYELLEILDMNRHNLSNNFTKKIHRLLLPITRLFQQYNSIKNARKNVKHHYDLSADFYKLFLDKDLQYSCAYFTADNFGDLEKAQLDKKYHIAQKLLLKPGMRVLDIGCGFGGMALYLAKNFDVNVVGLTLSQEQLRIAQTRAQQEGLQDKVQFYLRDYRHEKSQYDRIVSVGMFEHVGVRHYEEFFDAIKKLLKDDGVMLLHSITRLDGPGTTDAWIRKYIFPGGYAPAISETMKIVEDFLLVADIEILRLHYAKTLGIWLNKFMQNRDIAKKMFGEKFCLMWEFYLTASELEFIYDNTAVFQMQLTKKMDVVPITRDYL